MAKRALIFDMDGVIVDSNPVHREAWLKFNTGQGVETTEAMHQSMYGKRNDEIIRSFLGSDLNDAEVMAHGEAKETIFREMIGPMLPGALVGGLREFLERHQDVPIGCATNADAANVNFVLERGDLMSLFRVLVDGHQVSRPKPFPDIYLRTAELLGAEPENCLVFEDSYPGVEAAHAAGMHVVAIQTTHRDFPGTSLVIDNFMAPELEPFVQRFLSSPHKK